MSRVIPVVPIPQHPAPPTPPVRQGPKGRQPDALALAHVQAILNTPVLRRDHLIEYLHKLNDHHGHLAPRHIAALAHLMNLAQVEVFEVATFYHHFQVVDHDHGVAPRAIVRVCQSPSCRMAGSATLMAGIAQALPTDCRLEAVPCIGRCEQAPAVAIGQHEMGHAQCETVLSVLQQQTIQAQALSPESLSDYLQRHGYSSWLSLKSAQVSPESAIELLEQSGLRGLGGAGFPAGRKWRIVRNQPGQHWLAVNIDEGEPGTFKDRTYLEQHPHQFLEGVLIAAEVVQAQQVILYLRDEYHALRHRLTQEIAALQHHWRGHSLPNIELRRGAGAYVCGEESAMLESIEGKRGVPRQRPPYVAQQGLFGHPTLVHNAETLYWVPKLLREGTDWFTRAGRHGRQGLRSFSVSGRVAKPGVALAPAGITLRELVDEYCGGMQTGHTLYGYLPGGASGGMLPAALADIPLDFDTLQEHGCFIGSAAVVVFSQMDSALDIARHLMNFFVHESCGQCTPCRSGTEKASQLMQQNHWNIPLLQDLSQVMRDASICGLGQAAPNPLDCLLRHFPHEVPKAGTGEVA
ncbi:NAD(P)H-dependent oxidoreductase subunit E [Limnobacter humi]|uniref:NAD(P)H-dependent oxidoreductase subunit E n=1 Tax=Limnobacter humi TaxID=1778671 RepID=A0ABT1WDK5_9BURK|nr:NADH-ubiquinone oxidoreductase-F iron-sulfur binding region domain-containing protein [Limnobacter humi]MCQ8895603.1 NAD(P)H-dependent oxidoreductase subunit E [Limnobacter humi]